MLVRFHVIRMRYRIEDKIVVRHLNQRVLVKSSDMDDRYGVNKGRESVIDRASSRWDTLIQLLSVHPYNRRDRAHSNGNEMRTSDAVWCSAWEGGPRSHESFLHHLLRPL